VIVIGITGTNGAGKGTVVDFFKDKGFTHYSAREFIAQEVENRGLDVNRNTLTIVGNDLRSEFSSSYVIEKLCELALAKNKNCILDSVRIIKEVEFLRKFPHFYLIAVEADINIRYKRIIERKSQTDSVSFDEFRNQEEIIEASINPNEPNLKECLKLADKVFLNNSDIITLHEYCNQWLNEIS